MKTRPFILDLQMFAEDPQKTEEPAVNPDKNYVKAIADLKASTVSKADYEKLEEQNRQLLDAIINGNGGQDSPEDKTKRASIEELRKDLYVDKKTMTNLEYWEKTLQLRELLMEQGKTDPFVPVGHKVKATSADYAAAENVASGIKECIEAAGGDPVAFNNELRRRGLN